ncbi:MAG: ATP-grasp domain-containing protein [Syntrophomonadaceae bacterium]|nr:ATP-grasp domain-containing protein [Syntrophomonadaceae bacterium]
MKKQALIVIGANEFQVPLVEKARELEYETHVFAWEEGAVCRDIADYFYPISITDREEILKIARKIKPAGVISIGSDLAVITVNYLAARLGLVGNSLYSAQISTNKYEMRTAFRQANLPCPDFRLIDKNGIPEPLNMKFPLIIKPVDRSGSRGINRVDNREELDQAISLAIRESFGGHVIAEEYINGHEYSMEMISYQGEHYFLAITEKFTTGAPNYVETMHLQPGRIELSTLNKAIETIKSALDVLNIKNGASHSEFMVDGDDNIIIIEIGARMGGDYIGSDLVRLSIGYDFTRMVIDIAVGNKPDLMHHQTSNRAALVKFILSQRDLELFEELQKFHSEKIYSYGNLRSVITQPVQDSSQRSGYFIISCPNRNECLSLVGEH